ncbi:MAG TPA: LysM peptidoglycan-binding domain-containing M23 family metallopeptidase [Spirochaetota bacterium]|nr:LysM peptidoglycan-binding domain-containing M23 family metallopeptidase [Spirochaetota bacterium]
MPRYSIKKRLLVLAVFVPAIIGLYAGATASPRIKTIDSLDFGGETIKSLRDEIRLAIFVVKSGRDPESLPPLNFYRYRVKKGDTFWTILARTSQNIDTLMTVNSFSSPGQIETGRDIYIPNMRGIIYRLKDGETAANAAAAFRIDEKYIEKVNTGLTNRGRYIFIPCASVSGIERSMFLGTGFTHPLHIGTTTSGFGSRKDPFGDTMQFHRGIDIGCPSGSRVHAARDGKVVFTGYQGGYGLLVILQHAHDYYTYYGHLSRILVKNGDSVNMRNPIALSGNTGRTTGPHLHFEVRKGGTAVNPGVLFR